MEKCTKLKLKRKLKCYRSNKEPVQNEKEEKDCNSVVQEENTTDCVILTSESDSEGTQVQEKQRKNDVSANHQRNDVNRLTVKRSFLDVSSPELRQLRELVTKISTNSGVKKKLVSFPPHPDQESPTRSADRPKQGCLDTVQQALSYEYPALVSKSQLSPFPSMCDWCRKRRRQLDDDNKHRNPKSAKEKCDSVNSNFAKGSIKQVAVDNSCASQVSGHCLKKDSRPLTTEKPEIETHGQNLESDVISHQGCSSSESSTVVNNSHLIRDRNSNYYSLQSRNRSVSGKHKTSVNDQTRNITLNSEHENISSGTNSDNNDEVNNPLLEIQPNAGKETEDVSNFSLAFDSDSDFDLDDLDEEKESSTKHSEKVTCYSKTMYIPMNQSDQLSKLTSQKTENRHEAKNAKPNQSQCETKISSQNRDSLSKSQTAAVSQSLAKLSNQNQDSVCKYQSAVVSQSLAKLSNQNQDSVCKSHSATSSQSIAKLSNQNQDIVCKNQSETAIESRKKLVPVLSVAPSTSSTEQASSKTSRMPVQRCPLCQTQFANSMTQLEIDSHIAACLSAADEDVIW